MATLTDCIKFLVVLSVAAVFSTSISLYAADTLADSAGKSRDEALRLGERIYRDGILPSGEPVTAVVKGDITIEGTKFSCANCHMRGGLGSVEGGIYTPPTNGASLFKPLPKAYRGGTINRQVRQLPERRPVYTDATLADCLRFGTDSSGRVLNAVMPRYQLDDRDMALLIAYLHTLSDTFSPGATATNLSFATVITEDVTPEERTAMLAPLQAYVRNKNNLARYFDTAAGARSLRVAQSMLPSKDLAYRTLSLSVWELKGAPETWRSQLEEYNRREPVFALLGGMTHGDWQPVHKFCEDNRIPCIFPNTDFPVLTSTDWYTLYLSRGYYQEGEAAARYLRSVAETASGKPVVQVVQVVRSSREGKALSAGFNDTWLEFGNKAPVTVTLKPGEALSDQTVKNILAKEKPEILLIWDGPESLAMLAGLAGDRNRPAVVMMSSRYLGKSFRTMKEAVRDFTYLTYPYRFPRFLKPKEVPVMGQKYFKEDVSSIENQTYSIIELLNMSLMNMRGNYYRDTFLDTIDTLMDREVPGFERLSFGPGQRYASKGCYIVQLSRGDTPELIKKSDWVIH